MQPGPRDADSYVGRDGFLARNPEWAIPLLGMIAYIPAAMLTHKGVG